MITTFQDYLDMLCGWHMADITSAQSPEFQGLLTQACSIFERFSHTDQLSAMACMVGMLLGTVEGEPVPAWESLGVIITHKERMLQFQAQALVVFWDSMEARGRPVTRERIVAPKMKKAKKVKPQPGARVLQIASGKRKKKQLPGSKPKGSDWGGHGI